MNRKFLNPYVIATTAIFVFQTIIRIVMSIYSSENTTVFGDLSDQDGYWLLGNHFIDYLRNGNCERLPLYPFFLFLVLKITQLFSAVRTTQLFFIFLAQHVLLMWGIHLISKIFYRIYGSKLAYIIALTMYSFYYPLLLYPVGLLSESLFISLIIASLYYLCTGSFTTDTLTIHRQLLYFVLSGFFMGCSALVRPNILVFPCFLLPMLLLMNIRLYKGILAFAIVFCIVLSPWIIRNYSIYGRFAYVSVSGENLYKVNKLQSPLTNKQGKDISKRYELFSPREVEKQNLGYMNNSLKSFFDRNDVQRDHEYLKQALKNIKWHAKYEFYPYYKRKFDGFVPQLFQDTTLEYHYSNVFFETIPNYVNSAYHVFLVLCSFIYFIKSRFKLSHSDLTLISYFLYTFVLSLFAPVFPRILLPSTIFLFYFAVKFIASYFIKEA